jgi:2-dehydropantoate 2-reductase
MDEEQSRMILVYGAGPVGSILAYQLQDARQDVTVLARGQRLEYIQRYGVMLEPSDTGRSTSRKVNVIDRLFPEDAYDLVIVAVGKNHYSRVLPFLSANIYTPNVLFLGNNVEGSAEMVRLLGRDRVLLGFPFMNGTIEGRSVKHKAAEKPTISIGELDGGASERLTWIPELLEGAGFNVVANGNMEVWLKYHAAVILPLAFSYIRAEYDVKRLTGSREDMADMIRAMREGFSVLKELGHSYALDSLRRLEGLPMMLAVPYLRRELNKAELDYVLTRGEAMTGELEALDDEFSELKGSTSVQTPAYDELRESLEK